MPVNVLVFDSGVGGLSICQSLLESAPQCRLHYLSDNAAFPYGDKTPDFLTARACAVIDAALQLIDADIVVIACNSASTVVLPALRERLDIPVVGVVPAIKTAANTTRSGVFGLLATPGTVARDYTAQLVQEFAADKTLVAVGSSELVELVENYLYSGELDSAALASILEKFDQHPDAGAIDTVVLGCTHFPLVNERLAQLRPNWRWVDSGPAIARRVMTLMNLPENTGASPNQHLGEHSAWFTRSNQGFDSARLQRYLADLGFGDIAELCLDDAQRAVQPNL